MPKKKMPLYIARAKENIELLKLLDEKPDEFLDWKITIIFYIAVHYIHSYYCFHKTEPTTSHYDRDVDIDYHDYNRHKIKFTKVAYDRYDLLYEASIKSRYSLMPLGDPAERLAEQKKILGQCRVHLEIIKSFIQSRGCNLS